MNQRLCTWLTSVLLFYCIIFYCNRKSVNYTDYVDPFICTRGDHGQLHPGAVVPLGMLSLGPDTYPGSISGDGDWAHSGYNYDDDHIRGFSHLRIQGSGGTDVFDRGWFLSVLPLIGAPEITPDKYATAIDKNSEKASPGIYRVHLSDYHIDVALTVDKHIGFHKYTFPKSDDAHILFDTGSHDRIDTSSINITGTDEITGDFRGRGHYYFVAKFSKPFQSFATWDKQIFEGQRKIRGKRTGAILDFKTGENEVIYLKVGISAVSLEQARKNLNAEAPGWNFNRVAQRARRAWEDVLDNIKVQGNEEYKTIFYTALYHSFLQPAVSADVDGTYAGYDKEVHIANGYIHYDNYAFWDDFRTKFPLFTLIAPHVTHDVVLSLIDMYNQSSAYWTYGDSAHRPHESRFNCAGPDGYTPFLSCRNEHMLTVLLDAYVKNIIDTHQDKAYKGMRREIMVQMPDEYEETGYIPARPDQTCEFAYDNWCVAEMAKIVNNMDDYEKFSRRALIYKNTWDHSIGFFRARDVNGNWLDFPESPGINREKYMYEGTPWQWRWFVLHDIPGLIELVGGKEKFVIDLDYFFSNNLYQAGNQPDFHAPFLFNYAGAPWLTQKWVRKLLTEPVTQLYGTHEFFEKPIRDRIFKSTPDGYLPEMDDDYGSMAAWYVLSSIGLFQVCPGNPVYQLTAPIFDKVILTLDNTIYPGKQFILETRNLSAENSYIQSVTLYNDTLKNGVPYELSWISHQDIVNGGKLVFHLGPEPNKSWGVNR